jgi:hypothetical protein
VVVAPKTLPKETPNLSPCVCLEPKKINLTFFFLTSAAQCTALPLKLIQKHAHTRLFISGPTASLLLFLIELGDLLLLALKNKPIMGFTIVWLTP